MNYSRRDLGFLLPALMAAGAQADTAVLPSKCYAFDSIPVKTNAKNGMETRDVFRGRTQTGCPIALHISTLPPGQVPHPPHQHVQEEMMLIKQGTLEATISGQSTRIGPGSVIYINSNDLHGLKNVGDVPAQYFVIEIGRENG